MNEIKPLGNEKGAGNLVICEVLCLHIDNSVLNENKSMIDQTKTNPVARLCGNRYCKVEASNLFEVEKQNTQLSIGFYGLPSFILHSYILTGNQLAQLANVEAILDEDETFNNAAMTFTLKEYKNNKAKLNTELHKLATQFLNNGLVNNAWQVLLRANKPVQQSLSINR